MKNILQQPINELLVSDEFKEMAVANNFKTLDDLLEVPFHTLPSLPLSGYRIVKEILALLETEGLLNLVEE